MVKQNTVPSEEERQLDELVEHPLQALYNDGLAEDALKKLAVNIKLTRLNLTTIEHLEERYGALRYPLGKLAQEIIKRRAEARKTFGKGSGAELAYKQQANTIYGVIASRLKKTNNVVAANYITATARALAFALQMTLNGIQVITDGCNYRRDEVPALTFKECLAAYNDYPINRAGFKGQFLDSATIPDDDAAFTQWYREHVKRFFGVRGPDYDWLFGLHNLEHKKCGDPAVTSFDGLCCDGSANYIKLAKEGNGWRVLDFKARSYNQEATRGLGSSERKGEDRCRRGFPVQGDPRHRRVRQDHRVRGEECVRRKGQGLRRASGETAQGVSQNRE
jgi:hypothetical protein